ncbi:hypothetical protein GCM10007886_33390 [Methylobacterium gregans]|jgi:hypothetical protein|uniref:Uncharacterized protein n=1 Tax=Methylobacterium gregans TaxID=374424 RepID=A0AA37HQ24_9HYPH|nr:hypothetical protein [Methylobacterium gregans]MDQ0522410.1 hypothetical protein [Methylobacterium gregans]GJD79586.1 hypothetical protein NBEOAGPD_2815 [Methylobacterium gregans]GLS55155.1 hypothetical protein GCM10007886_33390 [Methylobacterium gregans]
MLQTPTPQTMLRTNLTLLRRALDRGAGDARLLTEGVLYVTDLEARVATGEMDAEAALADASRVARALTQTGTHRERRREPRPHAPAPVRREDCVVRVPGGPWCKPEEIS